MLGNKFHLMKPAASTTDILLEETLQRDLIRQDTLLSQANTLCRATAALPTLCRSLYLWHRSAFFIFCSVTKHEPILVKEFNRLLVTKINKMLAKEPDLAPSPLAGSADRSDRTPK